MNSGDIVTSRHLSEDKMQYLVDTNNAEYETKVETAPIETGPVIDEVPEVAVRKKRKYTRRSSS